MSEHVTIVVEQTRKVDGHHYIDIQFYANVMERVIFIHRSNRYS